MHPESGTVDDLRRLLDEAHARGIRVIADLVINHTSDQHPWFIESQAEHATTPRPTGTSGTTTTSGGPKPGWCSSTWSGRTGPTTPQRNQYYWHRFYSHQPDLNYDNPEVAEAMLDVVRFWLDLGLDGFRLDAVPFLYQRDGTAGENLPETHAFIRRIRAELDEHYPGRILLAEANGWPADVADYFGDDDECHLCFNFPLMPRLFMAVRREQSYPITEILAHTPEPPGSAQWAIFLRNHDELTLEMVTEEERDYLFAEYAKDPRMKRHMGIGRRLAPLLDRDRRLSELLYYLLFTLPGSPVLYYGDEIQMGDNLYLGDRDSVRTPMQWTPDRNGGFSRADFAQLYLPPLMDPVYGFSAVNVEAQQRNPSSFLHWMRRILAVRREFPVLGTGDLDVVSSANPSVLAFVRSAPARPRPGTGQPGAVRPQPQPAGPARRAPRRALGRTPAHRAAGPGGLPPHRHGSLSGDRGPVRLPLLRAGLSLQPACAPAGPEGHPARGTGRLQPAWATGTWTASSSAASSGFTMLISTPVPSSNPATVASLGTTWTCQW